MNLYSDDYASLAVDPEGIWSQTAGVNDIKEYMSFMDVKLCKGKMIANAIWHPMWTGTVAIAYVDAASNVYLTGPNTEDMVRNFFQIGINFVEVQIHTHNFWR